MAPVISVNFGAQRIAKLLSSILQTETHFSFTCHSVPWLRTDLFKEEGWSLFVFVCHVLACSDINGAPQGKELDCDPWAASARPLGSNLHLGCFALCWWPDCEKFSIAFVVPGPFKSLLFLISLPFADWSPARCSSPCWELFPWRDGSSNWTPSPGWGWHWLAPHVQMGWFRFQYWWCSSGKANKAPLPVCLLCDTLGADANTTGCPENWFGHRKSLRREQSHGLWQPWVVGRKGPHGVGTELGWALLPCWLGQVLEELCGPERARLKTLRWWLLPGWGKLREIWNINKHISCSSLSDLQTLN